MKDKKDNNYKYTQPWFDNIKNSWDEIFKWYITL